MLNIIWNDFYNIKGIDKRAIIVTDNPAPGLVNIRYSFDIRTKHCGIDHVIEIDNNRNIAISSQAIIEWIKLTIQERK